MDEQRPEHYHPLAPHIVGRLCGARDIRLDLNHFRPDAVFEWRERYIRFALSACRRQSMPLLIDKSAFSSSILLALSERLIPRATR